MRTSYESSDRRTIAFLAMSPLPDLDLFGPVEIFKTANLLGQPYDIVLLSADPARKLTAASGIRIEADYRFDEFDGAIDTLILLGDEKSSHDLAPDLVGWIRDRAASSRRVCSVCTGAFILAACGLLSGRRATTHWLFEKAFSSRFPDVQLDIAPIWTRDGKFYTSAGVSTGIDLALALVEDDCGHQVALKIAKGLVLFLRRTGTQSQFSQFISRPGSTGGRLADLPGWMLKNLSGDLSVDALAGKVGMSTRHFCRLFEQAFGSPPGEYVRKARLDESRRCLETSSLEWKAIAARCGIEAETFRRAFVREYGISPQHYAARNKA